MQVCIFGQSVEVNSQAIRTGTRHSLTYQNAEYSCTVNHAGRKSYMCNNGFSVRYCDPKNDQPIIKALNQAMDV